MNENNFSLFSALLVHFSSVKLISPHSDAFISFSKVKIANLADQIKDPGKQIFQSRNIKDIIPAQILRSFKRRKNLVLFFIFDVLTYNHKHLKKLTKLSMPKFSS
jgi:uncharacterized protein YaaR (DUF327 family)